MVVSLLAAGVGSGQRPPGPLKGRGHFFFLRAILEFFLAPGGLPLPSSSPSSSRRSPLLRQDPILFERFPPQFCGGLGHPRVFFFFFPPFFFVLFSSCFCSVSSLFLWSFHSIFSPQFTPILHSRSLPASSILSPGLTYSLHLCFSSFKSRSIIYRNAGFLTDLTFERLRF